MVQMTVNRSITASGLAIAVALAAAGAAQAQVTAQGVWDSMKAQMVTPGSGVTVGSESLDGGVLTVTDFAVNSTGEDGATFTMTVPQIVFTENGDGTVSVTGSETIPLNIATPADAAAGTEAGEVALTVSQPGLVTTVSGTPEAMTYDFAGPTLAVTLDSVTEAGAEVPAEASFTLNDLSGSYTVEVADMRNVDYSAEVSSVDVLVDITNPDDGSQVNLSGQIAGLSSQAVMALPLDMAAVDPDALLASGFSLVGGYTAGASNFTFDVAGGDTPLNGTAGTEGGATRFSLSGDGMAYDARATGVAIQATSPAMPFPITASLAEYGVNALIPLAQTEAPTDWALGINLTDLALNDEVWGLFDPQALLPRDPATVVMALSGTATLFADLTDPAQMAAIEQGGTPPGQVDSVSIDDLNISVAGAQVTGTGAFTLDNSDLTTFPGVPRPEGTAEFQINGLNALIDNLVNLGLVPQEQVMGLRMGLSLFATPVGEDQLQSRIEATADGQLLVNGQRLQ
jgi:hypothetical protein